MRKFSVALATVLAGVVAACGGGDDNGTAQNASSDGGKAKLEGSISVWIMDPGHRRSRAS